MSRLGQVEITTPEPYRWGDGSDGSHVYGPTEFLVEGNIAGAYGGNTNPRPQLTADYALWVETTLNDTDSSSVGYLGANAVGTNGGGKYVRGISATTDEEVFGPGGLVGKKAFCARLYDANAFSEPQAGAPLGCDYFFLWNESSTDDNGTAFNGKNWGGWEFVKKYTENGKDHFRRVYSRESNVPFSLTPFHRMWRPNGELYINPGEPQQIAAATTSYDSYRTIWYEDPRFAPQTQGRTLGDLRDAMLEWHFMEWIYYSGILSPLVNSDYDSYVQRSAVLTGKVGSFLRARINGVKNFTDVVIRDNTELISMAPKLNGVTNTTPIIIFATKSITFGEGVRLNACAAGTNTGNFGDSGWTRVEDPPNEYQKNNINAFSTGGGGGGGGANWTADRGTASQQKYYRRTRLMGTVPIGDPIETGGAASGGYGGKNALGGGGSDGSSASTTAISFMKSFGYTMKGKYSLNDNTDTDDFPILNGGTSGKGGHQGNFRTYYGNNGGQNLAGAGCIVLVAPKIIFPETPIENDFLQLNGDSRNGPYDGADSAGYESAATLLYARGESRRAGSDSSGGSVQPGQGERSAYEAGVGGAYNSLNPDGSRGTGSYHDGGGGSGGGGAGGSVVIIYNNLRGHPTIRTYGGQMGYTPARGAGNRGGAGGLGGNGYYLIGWKGIQNGEIAWVHEGHCGMRRGVPITARYTNQSYWDRRNRGPAFGETYGSAQWPALDASGQYISKSPNT